MPFDNVYREKQMPSPFRQMWGFSIVTPCR
ncbi:Uncharacterised protein [Ewingella americana]|uniref:Uncharacterized protein n=1 Tax=Ewingella americana TaxID=41202 RepID=A0A377NE78_9GAMM|nr:Uncharacterised protein [Ewingella americana]